ncbi:histone-lysine N-methyltransferase SETMAR [Trichonephila clavata]|uniref:Histone-lysine N-methyltransferase SETMAR n=1 Tax=Trichonephila clavata TaxID=2740835 RepID=A0A8X6GQH4_TRICU|nr:histone-lysine N-methyltransferase SETMAR [Trichonephila clavata]
MERRCVLNSWSKEEVRAVIRYEWARGVSGTEIHNPLVEVYGSGVMSKQMVRRWCRTFSDGRQQVEDIPRAGRTRTATTDANVGKVDDMIRANRRITIDEVAEELGISHERAQNIIHDILRYRKVSARWVPRQLTSTHQEQCMAVSLEHLVRYHEDGNDFLFRIVTGDETWVHHFTTESKAASMEWKHPSSPVRKKFKTTPSAGKVLLTVFWDAQGVLLLDFLEVGTINATRYCDTLSKLRGDSEKAAWPSHIWRSAVG